MGAVTVPVAKLGNTRVCIHVTFILAALVLAVSGYALHLIVFLGSLLFHEMGHILAASWMGAEVAKVVVWPFGAMAKVERVWQLSPPAESMVAFMGPFNSGLLLTATTVLQQWVMKTRGIDLSLDYPLWGPLQSVNLYLFAVNLIPCLPLDGGRLLRARLATRTGYLDASVKVARFGLYCGAALILFGIASTTLGHPNMPLLVTGAIICWGALEEREDRTSRNVLDLLTRSERLKQGKAIPVEEIMVLSDACVKDVVAKLRPSKYNVILVAGRGMKVMGRLSESRVLEAFYRGEVHRTMKELLRG
jgi:stage IV sporulation protein FB